MTLEAQLQEAEAELQLARIEAADRADQPLTPRQELFANEYLIDLNGTKAAIRSGYSMRSAAETASELLKLPKVQKRIAKAKAQRASRVDITKEHVLQEVALLAHSRIDWFVVDDDGTVKPTPEAPVGAMGAIRSIKKRTQIQYDSESGAEIGRTHDVTLTLWDKPGQLKLVGRHVDLFQDRLELTGKDGGPLEIAMKQAETLSDAEIRQRSLELAKIIESIPIAELTEAAS